MRPSAQLPHAATTLLAAGRQLLAAARRYGEVMDENKALRVVDKLRERGIDAHTEKAGVYQFGVRVRIPGGRQAIWDSDGAAGLEAQIMLDGGLVGFVAVIPGSEDYDDDQVVDAIASTDYDQPITTPGRTVPPANAPLPREGGVFRRFLGGFREK
jgi:hypothetical protein